MTGMHPGWMVLRLGALVLSSCLAGCENSCETCGIESIVGRVISPGGPVANAAVGIRFAYPSSAYDVRISTRTDENGEFFAAVAPGPYLLSVEPSSVSTEMWYAEAGPTYDSRKAEILWVLDAETAVRADFVLGGAEIRLELPAELQYGYMGCRIRSKSASRDVAYRGTNVAQSEVTFGFPNLAPGSYLAEIEVEGGQAQWSTSGWLWCALEDSGADSFEVRRLETTLWQGAASPGYLRGTIQGCSDLEGYGTSDLWVHGPDQSTIAMQRTDLSGEFDIPIFGPGDVRLAIVAGRRGRWVGGRTFEEATEFSVSPGAVTAVDGIGFSCILCRVAGQPGWEPYSASIVVRDESDHSLASGNLECAEEYAFVNLAPGVYYLSIQPSAPQVWRPQWYDRALTREEATPATTAAVGELAEVTFTLEEGGRIGGRVLDSQGEGAADLALLILAVNAGWTLSTFWHTDGDGSFFVEGLPDDDIKIGVRHPYPDASRATYYPGTTVLDSAEVITIIDAGEVTGIEWQLLP